MREEKRETFSRETPSSALVWECLNCLGKHSQLSVRGTCPGCNSLAVVQGVLLTMPARNICPKCGQPVLRGEITCSAFNEESHINCGQPHGEIQEAFACGAD